MLESSQAFYPGDHLDPNKLTGLVLCGMGGPDGPDAVQPFLRNLFSDPSIFPVPRLFSPLVGKLVSSRRAPKTRERYRQVSPDCVTPQLGTTLAQAETLARLLGEKGLPCIGGMAMRYWHPYPDETLENLIKKATPGLSI